MERPTDPRDRLIVALDVSTRDEALRLVNQLGSTASFYKVGLQLFVAEGMPFVRELMDRGLRVFLDLKMDDVDETIANAVREIAKTGPHLLTLLGGRATVRAAVRGRGESRRPQILSVTLLSSLDSSDLADLKLVGPGGRFATLEDYVVYRATQAVEAGADGVIASGETMQAIRTTLGARPLIVTPGIRPAGSGTDEHKRPTTPAAAIAAGADYLVVGRPIRQAADPPHMASAIVADIDRALAENKNR